MRVAASVDLLDKQEAALKSICFGTIASLPQVDDWNWSPFKPTVGARTARRLITIFNPSLGRLEIKLGPYPELAK